MRQFACIAVVLSISFVASGQKSDSSQRLNIIKLDLTSNFLYSEAFILSYERVVKPHQSFVITAGSEKFPTIASFGDHVKVKDDRIRAGVKLGAEYRFYLKKENKHRAPRGVYVGPYVSYHNFHNDRLLSYQPDNGSQPIEATFDARLNVLNVGAQLGYQFVLGNRWVIDLMFIGPSVSRYSAKLNLDGLTGPELDEAQKEIVDKLIGRFPLLGDILDEESVTIKGTNSAWAAGWRYQFQVGYHFGRKRK